MTDESAGRTPDETTAEGEGETVREARWNALRELERLVPALDRDAVRFQVVTEGERGLLGVGRTPARVLATGATAASGPRDGETEAEQLARELVERVAAALGVGARVDVVEGPDEVLAVCTGGDLGVLIGRHGQTIDALQHVATAALRRRGFEKRAVVDASGYRRRRADTLESLALRAAERAARGEAVELEPMTAVERRLIHERLKDVPGVRTESEGAEPNRRVVVSPA